VSRSYDNISHELISYVGIVNCVNLKRVIGLTFYTDKYGMSFKNYTQNIKECFRVLGQIIEAFACFPLLFKHLYQFLIVVIIVNIQICRTFILINLKIKRNIRLK
jgi:hypothetical protein